MNDLEKHELIDLREHGELREMVVKINVALFGDLNGNKGMEGKVDELWQNFVGGKMAWKIFIGFLTFLGLIGGLIVALIKILQNKW